MIKKIKINKQKIALERKEILDKAEKLKKKGITYKEMEEILNVNERTLRKWKKVYKELGLRGLEPQSKKTNRLVIKRILTDKILRIIKQTRGNVERNNRTLQEKYYLQNYNNLKTDIFYLKMFAKQIQKHYNLC